MVWPVTRGVLAAAAATLLTLIGGVIPVARAASPRDFFGVVSHGQLLPQDFERMGKGNVGTLRFALRWDETQPRRDAYEWSTLDSIVAGACAQGIDLLPFVYASPAWVADEPEIAPLGSPEDRAAWRSFLRRLVARYGPSGTFLNDVQDCRLIREWQIWNEPNYDFYWRPEHSAHEYARLLRISARAIHAVDRSARIVLAGLAPVKQGAAPWEFLYDLYQEKGTRKHFDAIAVHPYAPTIDGIRFVMRRVLDARNSAGDRDTPLEITELGWASEGPAGSAMVKGQRGQARMLRRSFELLEKRRHLWRLRIVLWFSWQDAPPGSGGGEACSFCEKSGLFTYRRQPKPAWTAFGRATRR